MRTRTSSLGNGACGRLGCCFGGLLVECSDGLLGESSGGLLVECTDGLLGESSGGLLVESSRGRLLVEMSAILCFLFLSSGPLPTHAWTGFLLSSVTAVARPTGELLPQRATAKET
jgi:hypothetical protein